MLKTIPRLLPILALVALVGPARAAKPTGVATEAELAAAFASGASTISLEKNVSIVLTDTLVRSAAGAVEIRGHGATIDASGLSTDALVFDGGADVAVSDLTLCGGGGRGLVMDVPAGVSGTVTLSLRRVTVCGFTGFAVHVDDNDGSDASVAVDFRHVVLTGNGVAVDAPGGIDDRDPLRVDEKGDGDVDAVFASFSFVGNGDEGVQLEEAGDGDLDASFTGGRIASNDDNGIDLTQDDAGTGTAQVKGVKFADNGGDEIDLDGVGLK